MIEMMMRRRDAGLRLLSAAGAAWLTLGTAHVTTSTTGQPQGRPNIVLILADDFGYGSPNFYGSSPRNVRTPNMDRLAKEGANVAICSRTQEAVENTAAELQKCGVQALGEHLAGSFGLRHRFIDCNNPV